MTLKVFKSQIVILKFQNHLFLRFFVFVLRTIILKLFKNINFMKTQIFHKMKYDLKGHPRTLKVIQGP